MLVSAFGAAVRCDRGSDDSVDSLLLFQRQVREDFSSGSRHGNDRRRCWRRAWTRWREGRWERYARLSGNFSGDGRTGDVRGLVVLEEAVHEPGGGEVRSGGVERNDMLRWVVVVDLAKGRRRWGRSVVLRLLVRLGGLTGKGSVGEGERSERLELLLVMVLPERR